MLSWTSVKEVVPEPIQRRLRQIEEFISGAYPQSRTYFVSVPTANAIKLCGNNARRTKLIFQNRDAANPIFFGEANQTDAQLAANGLELVAGASYFDDIVPFTGEIWAISTGGAVNVRVRDEWRESR